MSVRLGGVQDTGKRLRKGHGLVITFAQPPRREQRKRHRSCVALWPPEPFGDARGNRPLARLLTLMIKS